MSKFFMMIGLPGSGKSFEAKKIAEREDAVIVSSDAIRQEINGDEGDQNNCGKVFEIARKRIKKALASGQNVIMDSTNISCKRRMALLEEMKKHISEATAVLMAAPFEICVRRQCFRERKVDKDVIIRMYHNFTVPCFYEGWDVIEVVYPENVREYHTDYISGLMDGRSDLLMFDQKNPHHSLTLGEHLLKCYNIVSDLSQNAVLREAALLHDIGKVKTQTFDEDGTAHYYQHHCVSGYDSLFEVRGCSNVSDVLLRAAYIQWHMGPYFWEKEKTRQKYEAIFGKEFYKELMILHTGDVTAH